MTLFEHAMNAAKQADIVLEVLDARFPEQTRNLDIERKLLQRKKRLILVLNKCDLIGKEKSEQVKKVLQATAPCIFVSANKRLGTTKLKELVFTLAGKENMVRVAVIGYPNTGKSSVINALAGRKSARTSAQAGFTRGAQFVRLSKNVLLIDSPGIIPYGERNEFELALVAAKSANQLQDLQGTALQLIEWFKEQNSDAIKRTFGVEPEGKGAEQILEEIAVKKKRLLKGGIPDVNASAAMLLKEWQNGNIKL